MLGGYQAPPPPASEGTFQGSLTVERAQRTAPVQAFRAYSIPRPPGGTPIVLVYTVSPAIWGAESMIGSPGLTRKRLQSSFPVVAASAKTVVGVAPKTRPPETASPFGPRLSAYTNRCRQSTRPLVRSRANTSLRMSCRYTTPFATTGVAVNDPAEPSGALSRNRQMTWSRPTSARSIPLRVSARVEPRSRF